MNRHIRYNQRDVIPPREFREMLQMCPTIQMTYFVLNLGARVPNGVMPDLLDKRDVSRASRPYQINVKPADRFRTRKEYYLI